MSITADELKQVGEVAVFLGEIHDSKEMQAILDNSVALLEKVSSTLKPKLEELSEFRTALDIKAIKTMIDAGIPQEQAVALRLNNSNALSFMFNTLKAGVNKK